MASNGIDQWPNGWGWMEIDYLMELTNRIRYKSIFSILRVTVKKEAGDPNRNTLCLYNGQFPPNENNRAT